MSAPVPLATVADVQARTDVQLTTEQQARAAVLIADATALARSRVPDLPRPQWHCHTAPLTITGKRSASRADSLLPTTRGSNREHRLCL